MTRKPPVAMKKQATPIASSIRSMIWPFSVRLPLVTVDLLNIVKPFGVSWDRIGPVDIWVLTCTETVGKKIIAPAVN